MGQIKNITGNLLNWIINNPYLISSIICSYFFILPILETRAEIGQKKDNFLEDLKTPKL
jgi:hypothetical protein